MHGRARLPMCHSTRSMHSVAVAIDVLSGLALPAASSIGDGHAFVICAADHPGFFSAYGRIRTFGDHSDLELSSTR